MASSYYNNTNNYNESSASICTELVTSSYQNSPPGKRDIKQQQQQQQQQQQEGSKPPKIKIIEVFQLENIVKSRSSFATTTSTRSLSDDDDDDNTDEYESSFVFHTDNNNTIPNKVKLLFTLLGMGTLCPYNALVSCIDWFNYYLQDDGDDDDGGSNLESQMAASCITALVLTTLLLLFTSTSSTSKNNNSGSYVSENSVDLQWYRSFYLNHIQPASNRMYIGFTLDILVLCIFVSAQPSKSAIVFLSVLIGIGDAIAQSGVYAIAASIHSQCSAYVSLGSALSGFVISILRIFSMSLFSVNRRVSSCVFFVGVVCLMCACFWASRRVAALEPLHQHQTNEEFLDDSSHELSSRDLEEEESNVVQIISSKSNYWNAFNQVGTVLFCMLFNFFITLSLFPGVVTSLPSTGLIGSKWLPILLIAIFNLFDFIGRIILTDTFGSCKLIRIILSSPTTNDMTSSRSAYTYIVFLPCLLRIIFLPTLLVTPVFNDVFTCIIIALLGFSNGFIASACFMMGPELVPSYWKEDVSLWLLLSLYIGLLLGAFCGMLF